MLSRVCVPFVGHLCAYYLDSDRAVVRLLVLGSYLLVGVAFAFDEEGGAAAASWPPAGRFRGTPACLWVVPRYVPAWVAAGSIAATRNLMAAAASANCAVLVRHACDVPVRASLHVG